MSSYPEAPLPPEGADEDSRNVYLDGAEDEYIGLIFNDDETPLEDVQVAARVFRERLEALDTDTIYTVNYLLGLANTHISADEDTKTLFAQVDELFQSSEPDHEISSVIAERHDETIDPMWEAFFASDPDVKLAKTLEDIDTHRIELCARLGRTFFPENFNEKSYVIYICSETLSRVFDYRRDEPLESELDKRVLDRLQDTFMQIQNSCDQPQDLFTSNVHYDILDGIIFGYDTETNPLTPQKVKQIIELDKEIANGEFEQMLDTALSELVAIVTHPASS